MIELGSPQVSRVSRAPLIDLADESVAAARPVPESQWKQLLLEELDQSTVRRRLSRGLIGVGFIHLICFVCLQATQGPVQYADLRHPLLWLAELVAILVYLRKSLGKDWIRSSSAINLAAKFWTTFLILSFNLATLNTLTGFEIAWYKPALATLSTFLFASMGWLLSPWFFVLAVQMWATGLLMVNNPHWCFLIYGVSWWIALAGIAVWIRPVEETRAAWRQRWISR